MAFIEGEGSTVDRVELGLYSMDRALSGKDSKGNISLGWPMTVTELFGFQGLGKTTVATSVAGMVAQHYQSGIVYVPFEHVDRDLMANILDSVGCDQVVSLMGGWDMVKKLAPSYKPGKDEKITDELMLDCYIQAVRDERYCVGVIDSLSAIVTIAEAESSVADRNMGKARVVSNFSRSALQSARMKGTPFSTIMITHKVTPMGGGTPTNTGAPTTGGEVKKNIAKVRIGMRRMPEPTMYDLEENCYILEGTVDKNNFGKDKKKFYVAILGGYGIHKGLTAMYDCKALKICTFGKSVTLGGEKYGSLRTIIEHAHAGNDEFFQPFVDALKDPSKFGKVREEDEGDFEESE